MKKSVLQIFGLDTTAQPSFIFSTCSFSLPSVLLLSLGEEHDKDDEEDDEDQKDLDHEPAVGGDRLEVLEDLCVGGLHVQLGVLHVGVDPEGQTTERTSKLLLSTEQT